jgi:hypothetical protein
MPKALPRLAKAGILALLALALAAPALAAAADPSQEANPSTNPIVATAMKYQGTYQGQCWTFAATVIKEALGKDLGRDYRQGYFDAGAVEVSVSQALPGDIVQIADDSYTEPDADYPGLHTFIITKPLGDGTFDGIDSNSQWDGMVRLRQAYDPAASAARYPNLNFHIYRFVGPTAPAPTATKSAAPTTKTKQLAPGDRALVVAGGDPLNLRTAAGISAGIITQLPDGAVVTVMSQPTRADGHTWLQVSSTYGLGWVASEYLSIQGASLATSTQGGSTAPLYGYRSLVPFVTGGN